jgi:hypothetical protein
MTPEEHKLLLEKIIASLERIEFTLARCQIPIMPPVPTTGDDKPDSSDPAPVEGNDETQLVDDFLASKGIVIKVKKAKDAADAIIDNLSLFLGERYHALQNILMKIKRSMQTGALITENISRLPQEDISSVCQFCSRLHEIAFLEEYEYLRSPRYLIHAKTTMLPKAQMFFSGQWLERFVLQKLRQAYTIVQAETGETLSFEYLINPQVTLLNGDDFELDIVAVISGAPIWIEAKSGNYQQHIRKYSRLAKQLELDSSHAVMVLTDVVDKQCAALSSLFSMTVVNLSMFENQILEILRNDQGARDAGFIALDK